MTSPASALPQLAPPGAGLPKPELLAANILFHSRRILTRRDRVTAMIHEECKALTSLVGACDPVRGARQVLIKRLRGLEDSSRNWSVYMTLEHLRIVNASITGVISQLASGHVPLQPASTAAVKPAPGIGPEVVQSFRHCCTELSRAAAAVPDLRTPSRFPHPWFGPLDAAGWYFMAAFHLRLHRRQVESILVHLQAGPRPGA